MKFIIKFFSEITIKSKPVRKRLVKNLYINVRDQMLDVSDDIRVQRQWDIITVEVPEAFCGEKARIIASLSHISGIAHFNEVEEWPLPRGFDAITAFVAKRFEEVIVGKTFAVRCKRVGNHDFTSSHIEREVGAHLYMQGRSAGVNLKSPEVLIRVEIIRDTLYLVREKHVGLGGFPLGGLDPVLSLLSGGFDSPVASYLTMKRGMPTHFCFFNLGGREHERGVKEVATFLWLKYGAKRKVKFVAVPFDLVVAEILQNITNSQMGVVLKRMMMRAAAHVADELSIPALVTGESVAQVSSQTLVNLSVIDAVTDSLILRPLAVSDKSDIIAMSRDIGTFEFAESMPEYCGVISVKPTTRAKKDRIEYEETKFDFSVLDQALSNAVYTNIDRLADEEPCSQQVEIVATPLSNGIVVDIRHPDEVDRNPMQLTNNELLLVPFYELHSKVREFDLRKPHLLYCDKGVMSRLHTSHLLEQGYQNIMVYRPPVQQFRNGKAIN